MKTISNPFGFPGFSGNDPFKKLPRFPESDNAGSSVCHCKPKGTSYFDVGQWFRVRPGAKYLFRVRYKSISGTTAKGMMLCFIKGIDHSLWRGFSEQTYDRKTCRFEGVFTAPENSVTDADGFGRLRVVVADSVAICEFYCTGFELYLLGRDGKPSGDNLFRNADFKHGFAGWSACTVQPEEESEKTTFTEGFKFIKMLRFSEELFMEDYSDKFLKDGKEWAKEFE